MRYNKHHARLIESDGRVANASFSSLAKALITFSQNKDIKHEL